MLVNHIKQKIPTQGVGIQQKLVLISYCESAFAPETISRISFVIAA